MQFKKLEKIMGSTKMAIFFPFLTFKNIFKSTTKGEKEMKKMTFFVEKMVP